MKNVIAFIIIFSCLTGFKSCTPIEKEMLVSTGTVTSITTNSAEASGQILDLGKSVSQHGHCYGKTANVTVSNLKTQLGIPPGRGGFTSQLTSLEQGTKYYIKAYLSDGSQTVYGEETSFSTVAVNIPVAPSSLTATTASNSQINLSWTDNSSNEDGFKIERSPDGISNWTEITTVGTNIVVYQNTGLPVSTHYYFRVRAFNIGGNSAYSNTANTSTYSPPTAATSAATIITNTSATMNGAVNANGSSTAVTFEYGTTNLYGTSVSATPSPVTGSIITSVSALLTNLPVGTQYHFRVKAVSEGGTSYGDDFTFVTLQLPAASTNNATYVTNLGATLNGTVTAANLSTSVTFEYGQTISYGLSAPATQSPVSGNASTSVSAVLTGLTAGTTYHFRVKAVNSGGTSVGTDSQFITLTAFTIGQSYGGGIVFYVDGTGQHGLIVNPTPLSSNAPWGCSGTWLGAGGTAIGTGAANTVTIVNGCSTAGIAARLCSDLILNGYNDWFLPSTDELGVIWDNKVILGITNVGWSSSEASTDYAWDAAWKKAHVPLLKTVLTYVIAARAF
jgi:hypothetical protein